MSQTPRVPNLFVGSERPGLDLFWYDSVGRPVVVHGYTFSVTFEQEGVKTTINNCSVTADAAPTVDTGSSADVPTLHLDFNPNSLDSITPGPLTLRVVCTSQNRHRTWRGDITVDE